MHESDDDGGASRFLTMDLSELADILRKNRTTAGSFVITDGLDPRKMSKIQRDQLQVRIREAVAIITSGDSNGIETGDLFARLQNVAVNEDGTAALQSLSRFQEDGESTARRASSTSSNQTDDFENVTHFEEESFHRSQLELYGGRPVCSVETWRHIMDHPESSSAVLWPWLMKQDDGEQKSVEARREGSMSIVFSQQLDRWWEFEKWQWMNRDNVAGSSDIPFARYLESRLACYEYVKLRKPTAAEDFVKSTRSLWEDVLSLYEPPHGKHNFTGYHKHLKKLLAPYPFANGLQLRRDPRKQTAWTTWLEYLGYELWWLDNKTYGVELKEKRYQNAWTKFLQDSGEIERKRVLSWKPERWRPIQGLSDATEHLKAAETAIFTFVKSTAVYRQRECSRRQQQARVDWIVKEARIMMEEKEQMKNEREGKRKRGQLPEANSNNWENLNAQQETVDSQPPKRQHTDENRRTTRSTVQVTTEGKTRQSGRLRRAKT